MPEQVWKAGINGFSEQLREYIGKKHNLIVSDFSTTTEVDRLSSMAALMGAMKHYFEYKMMLLCGLSRVTVAGTPEDWANIIDRTQALSEFNLTWWTDHLLPVLEQLELASEGRPDIEFWKAIYLKHRKGSGSQADVSGWVNTFFPYVSGKGQMVRNPYLDWQNTPKGRGLDIEDFPSGLVSVPVEVDDQGRKYDCKFYGGLVGVLMAGDFTVRAESGIAIQDITE